MNGIDYLDGKAARELLARYRAETGLVLCFRYPPRAAFGLAPDRLWTARQLICVWVDGNRIRRRPYGRAVHVAGDNRADVVDSVEVDLSAGQVVHLKITPELETFLGENPHLGICAIQDHRRSSVRT